MIHKLCLVSLVVFLKIALFSSCLYSALGEEVVGSADVVIVPLFLPGSLNGFSGEINNNNNATEEVVGELFRENTGHEHFKQVLLGVFNFNFNFNLLIANENRFVKEFVNAVISEDLAMVEAALELLIEWGSSLDFFLDTNINSNDLFELQYGVTVSYRDLLFYMIARMKHDEISDVELTVVGDNKEDDIIDENEEPVKVYSLTVLNPILEDKDKYRYLHAFQVQYREKIFEAYEILAPYFLRLSDR